MSTRFSTPARQKTRPDSFSPLSLAPPWAAPLTRLTVGDGAGKALGASARTNPAVAPNKDRAVEACQLAGASRTEKIKTLGELAAIVAQAKARGQRVVFANGCFDVLHGGHVSYLEDAAAQGDLLIVAVNSDRSTRGLKGEGRPFYPQEHRLEILAAMEMVDYVVVFDDPTVTPLLEILRPHVHAKGTDYTRETVPERDTALALGIEIYIAGAPKENASRKIIGRIRGQRSAT